MRYDRRMSLRHRVGSVIYDWPAYIRAMRGAGWTQVHNRREQISSDGRGVRCEWRFSSDLHLGNVFPSIAERLMRTALSQWPVVMRDAPEASGTEPAVTFVIGHRGEARLPNLLATLRSVAGQCDVPFECIVVEQAARPQIGALLPSWVRYLFQECTTEYNRSATFNAAIDMARGELLILHDNDMLVPSRYASEALARAREGWEFIDLKRYIFYLDERTSADMFERDELTMLHPVITQNLRGGSIAALRHAYDAIGGFDEEFVGWGGEDDDFWDRAETSGKTYRYGYLPIVHLYHAPQPGKVQQDTAPAVIRYQMLESVPAADRIRRLRARRR
jgi:hypothetical protein